MADRFAWDAIHARGGGAVMKLFPCAELIIGKSDKLIRTERGFRRSSSIHDRWCISTMQRGCLWRVSESGGEDSSQGPTLVRGGDGLLRGRSGRSGRFCQSIWDSRCLWLFCSGRPFATRVLLCIATR